MFRFMILTLAAITLALVFSARVASADELKCAGMITKIEGEIVTVKTMDAEHELTMLPATKITLDNKPAQVKDLKVGYKVKCSSDKEEKKILCRSLDAVSKEEG
jgi:hypothetical protein